MAARLSGARPTHHGKIIAKPHYYDHNSRFSWQERVPSALEHKFTALHAASGTTFVNDYTVDAKHDKQTHQEQNRCMT
jgi:hypothetical protein